MYKGRRYRRKNKKPILLLVSVILVLTVAVGGTLAYLVTQTEDVNNTFIVQQVPIEVTGKETIKNISDEDGDSNSDPGTPAYIRAAIVANWVSFENKTLDENVVYSQKPDVYAKLGKDWVEGTDGYYYYTKVVEAGYETTSLSCSSPVTGRPDGYIFSYEIMAQSIQANGIDSEGKTPVELAWGVEAARAVGAIQ